MAGHYFISYSRKQFYFAESIVLHLQNASIPVWFDIQELAPGELWREQIQEGLDNAIGLVLIASEASLESKYVEQEWRPTLEAGKPVYVVLFEPCVLPDELKQKAAAIIDMRGQFNKNFKRLLTNLRGTANDKDPVPAPNRFRLPFRFSISVGILLAIMIPVSVIAIFFLILVLPSVASTMNDMTLYVLVVIWVWFVVVRTFQFIRRDFTYWEMFTALIMTSVTYALIFPPLVIPVLIVVMYTFNWTQGAYRWLPTGEAPGWMRRRFGGLDIMSLHRMRNMLAEQETPETQRYTIYHAEEDDRIAKRIEHILSNDGHVHVEPGEATDQYILLLTNRTPVNMLEDMVKQYENVLTPLIASNVDPRSASEDIGEFQFIDFRRHERGQLEAVSLTYRHPEETKLIYSLNVIPQRTTDHIVPSGVRRFSAFLWLNAMAYLFIGCYLLYIPIQNVKLAESPNWGGSIFFAATHLLGAVVNFWMVWNVQNRRINVRQFRHWLWVNIAFGIPTAGFGLIQGIIYAIFYRPIVDWLPMVVEKAQSDVPLLNSVTERQLTFAMIRDSVLTIVVVVLFAIQSYTTIPQ